MRIQEEQERRNWKKRKEKDEKEKKIIVTHTITREGEIQSTKYENIRTKRKVRCEREK